MSQSAAPLLFVMRHSPYGSHLARAALDAVLAAGAIGQAPHVLFMDDGVWQLHPGQDGGAIERKTLAKTLASLPLYDIEHLFVDSASLEARGLGTLSLPEGTQRLAGDELATFLDGYRCVIGF